MIFESYWIVQNLRIMKFFYDIGVFEAALSSYTWISGDDFYELFLNGMQHLAPIYRGEELGAEVCCGGHYLYHFSDPALIEYYRLCRLYEYKHSISPEDNPYIEKADKYYLRCCNYVNGDFGVSYDNYDHPKEIQIETCPERSFDEFELMVCIYKVMEFYRNEVITLKFELMRDGMVWLPALPAPKGDKKREKPTKRRNRRKNQTV